MPDYRQWSGDEDEYPYRRHVSRGGPTERQCDQCGRWSHQSVNYAQVWWFCDLACKESWLAQDYERKRA